MKSTGSRPSLREIAALAGVSRMAVSRAFQPEAEISAALRSRILELAGKMGYRPDPLIGEVMRHFARGRRGVHRETLGVLWWGAPPAGSRGRSYAGEIRQGVEEAAQRYGCAVDHLDANRQKGLQRVLETRGIHGLILTPSFDRVEAFLDLDWSKFAVVAAGNSVREPQVHRVVHSHYTSGVRVMQEVRARPFRRPVLVVAEVTEERIRRAYTAAFLATQAGTPARRIFRLGKNRFGELEAWLGRQRPDAVIYGGDEPLPSGLAQRLASRGVALVGLNVGFDAEITCGIRQHPRSMGVWAVDLLMQMRWRGETGIPAEPATLTVEGTWVAAN